MAPGLPVGAQVRRGWRGPPNVNTTTRRLAPSRPPAGAAPQHWPPRPPPKPPARAKRLAMASRSRWEHESAPHRRHQSVSSATSPQRTGRPPRVSSPLSRPARTRPACAGPAVRGPARSPAHSPAAPVTTARPRSLSRASAGAGPCPHMEIKPACHDAGRRSVAGRHPAGYEPNGLPRLRLFDPSRVSPAAGRPAGARRKSRRCAGSRLHHRLEVGEGPLGEHAVGVRGQRRLQVRLQVQPPALRQRGGTSCWRPLIVTRVARPASAAPPPPARRRRSPSRSRCRWSSTMQCARVNRRPPPAW